jgi:hypothetical protein
LDISNTLELHTKAGVLTVQELIGSQPSEVVLSTNVGPILVKEGMLWDPKKASFWNATSYAGDITIAISKHFVGAFEGQTNVGNVFIKGSDTTFTRQEAKYVSGVKGGNEGTSRVQLSSMLGHIKLNL